MKNLDTAYLLNLSDIPTDPLERMLPLLDDRRRSYVESFSGSLPRTQALCSTLLLDYALIRAGIPASLLVYSENGKPVVQTTKDFPDRLFVSASHSGGLVTAALSLDPVGIDIQKNQGGDPLIFKYFLHPDEQSYLSSLPEEEREHRFYALWCRKESYIKATGCEDPQSVSSLSPGLDCIYYDFSYPGYSAAIYGNVRHCPYQLERVSLLSWMSFLGKAVTQSKSE